MVLLDVLTSGLLLCRLTLVLLFVGLSQKRPDLHRVLTVLCRACKTQRVT